MEPTVNDDIVLIILVADLFSAHGAGLISNNTFWNAMGCVQFARQNPEDNVARLAAGAISTLVWLLEALPEVEQTLDNLLKSILSKSAENEEAKTRLKPIDPTCNTSVDAATQTNLAAAKSSATASSISAETQTEFTISAPQQITAEEKIPCRQLPKVFVRKFILISKRTRRFRSPKPKVGLSQGSAQGTKKSEPIDTKSSVSGPKPAESLPTTLAREDEDNHSATSSSVGGEGPSTPATASSVASKSQSESPLPEAPAVASVFSSAPATIETPLYREEVVASPPAPSTPPQQQTTIAVATPVKKYPFKVEITSRDRRDLLVYDGKVDFYGVLGKHRIQRAWESYKQPTRNAMKAMTELFNTTFDDTDLSLLDKFKDRLSIRTCEDCGEVDLPETLLPDLHNAIIWREGVCVWYDNLQVAVEADEIRNDDSDDELRDGTDRHKHVLSQFQAIEKAAQAYAARREAAEKARVVQGG